MVCVRCGDAGNDDDSNMQQGDGKGEGKSKSKNGCQNESGKWEKGESEGNEAN